MSSSRPKAMLVAPALVAVLVVGGPAASAGRGGPKERKAACPAADAPLNSSNRVAVERAILCLVNKERRKRGLTTLTGAQALAKAALAHSGDMARNRYFNHTAPNGSNPGDRAQRAGFSWSTIGENIAGGQESARKVMLGWMASQGHCTNILRPEYRSLGVGAVAVPRPTYTQLFGTRLGQTNGSGPKGPASRCPYKRLVP